MDNEAINRVEITRGAVVGDYIIIEEFEDLPRTLMCVSKVNSESISGQIHIGSDEETYAEIYYTSVDHLKCVAEIGEAGSLVKLTDTHTEITREVEGGFQLHSLKLNDPEWKPDLTLTNESSFSIRGENYLSDRGDLRDSEGGPWGDG
jgi:hypothetical protein